MLNFVVELDCVSNVYSAVIILRKYVNERWSPFFPSFKGNAPPVEVRRPFFLTELKAEPFVYRSSPRFGMLFSKAFRTRTARFGHPA